MTAVVPATLPRVTASFSLGLHAEGLYKNAQGADLTLQLKTLNSFTQLAMAYVKSIAVHDYNTHPVVDNDR